MKKTSWEIIVAGILLLIVAIVITGKSDNNRSAERRGGEHVAKEKKTSQEAEQNIRIIDLKGLSNLDEIKDLDNLSTLKSLDKLKSLAALIPAEAKAEVLAELNAAIQELEGDSFSINIDLDDEIVLLKKEYDVSPGEWKEITTGVYAFNKTFDASTFKNLSLHLSGGSITLVGTDELKSTLSLNASGEIAARELLKEMIDVQHSVSNNKLDISISNNKKSNSNIQLQTVITVPTSLNLNIFTGGGHIDATNAKGDLEFKTSGGHIKLKDMSGEITAYTEGGHISLFGANGDVSMKSLGGHLSADNVNGVLEMRTSGGNIKAKNIIGSVNAFTSGGNINVLLDEITGEVQARNGAGQIELTLPSNADISVNVSGTKVEIDSGFRFSGNASSNEISGKIGNGTFPVTVKTGYGTVIILKK